MRIRLRVNVLEKERFTMRISQDLLARLDAWRHTLPIVPPRAAAIKQVLATFLEEEEDKAIKRGRK